MSLEAITDLLSVSFDALIFALGAGMAIQMLI